MASPAEPQVTVPEGYSLHTENTAHILIASKEEAFLNPVQEFNRDLSIACIRTWSERLDKEKEEVWRRAQEKRARKGETKKARIDAAGTPEHGENEQLQTGPSLPQEASPREAGIALRLHYRPYRFTLLEALSATGLRSIRYAKEIPLVKHVIANDLSETATAAIRRNIQVNGIEEVAHSNGASATKPDPIPSSSPYGKIKINEGDACALMYNHRAEKSRVDVVDLDPYGTAAPFIDGAVQCIEDGGLMCVTCTDLAVLATTNYPEKCYSNYGGIPVKAEYCHEAALRLVLHSVSTAAGRYGRYIEPLLSLSIDFYVRLFIRIKSAPIEVKKASSKTAMYYVCVGCQTPYEQPLGRMIEQTSTAGNTNYLFKTHSGPPTSSRCSECGSALHIAGPLWSGPIHETDFVKSVIEHVDQNPENYGTSTRMKGMLTVASEELNDPFYFTPSRVSSFFHCVCPPLDDVASALLHAGHQVSRSHACAGSLKTSATREDVHDVFRSWVKTHPVKMDKISDQSPARRLLNKEPRAEANFTRHPDSMTRASAVKLVRYQENPTANWGPGSKAQKGVKRKRDENN
ncbi:N2,N2-dimethylguanosine tRNA methyltransferase [Coniophora puteana RWD-64-598 SS2]|uniref:tRNA (guanine(26)-N(2))-dimethyltransferase n=1 Tax=Coniophora puteana (strain RWD-64-598) TaxID=741705 RepID=A0A5M3N1H0_CONPW|nr:N2,N2-dimethylguanosine tRNA methyltransferase [Coniophora puteana RWD-64-598 SS2]EIW85156.1 N2,N2-dimethylguanosine tRNA methyltransferase [Coniophora puteana RWD-64-598 SS2]